MRYLLLTGVLAFTNAASFDQTQLDEFVDEVVQRHQLERSWVSTVVEAAEVKQSILDAISRPAERTREWHEYRDLFLSPTRISAGRAFWDAHQPTLARVAEECGVPAEIIVAIIGIETHYGRQTGGYRVIDALATLAFAYPPRSRFFRGELEQFLLLVGEHDIDPLRAQGSYAGAMGAAQFISSSYRRYAVDSSGDGRIDLWNDWRDVIGSVANYLHTFGWQPGQPIVQSADIDAQLLAGLQTESIELKWSAARLRSLGLELPATVADDAKVMVMELQHEDGPRQYIGYQNFYVITRYNRSRLYAMAVHELGRAIAQQRAQPGVSD